MSNAIEYGRSWPREATQCDLVPLWAGEFVSFNDWVNFATKRLTGTIDKLTGREVQAVCIDALGRRCTMGAHFSRARDEDAFPVRYFFECQADAPKVAPDAEAVRERTELRNNAILLANICQKARHSSASVVDRDNALRDASQMLRDFARALDLSSLTQAGEGR